MRQHFDVPPGLDPKPYFACAFGIGIVAAAVMTLLMWLARLEGLTQLDLAMTLGTASVFSNDASPGAWTQGFIVMLLAGGVFALVYAWVFEYWPHHAARAWLGAMIGVAHSVVGGAMMAVLMPALHGSHPSLLADPGFMGIHYGSTTVAVFVGLHVVYGAIIGGWMHFAPAATRYLDQLAARDQEMRQEPPGTPHAA